MISRRRVLAAGVFAPALTVSLASPAAADAAAEPPSLDELLRPASVLDTALSPNGSRVAVLREHRQGGKRVAYLVLAPSADLENGATQVAIGDHDVQQVEWANDERLLVWVNLTHGSNGKPNGYWYGDAFVPLPVRRVIAMGPDGGNQVTLFSGQSTAIRRNFDLSRVVDLLPSDPAEILMQIWDQSRDCWALHRVDVYTGESRVIERGVRATDGWFIQNGTPMLRYDSNLRGTTVTLMARAPGATEWSLVRKMRRNELRKFDELDFVGSTPEAGVLLISHRAEGEDIRAIRTFDVRTLQIGDIVVKPPAGRDLEGVFTDDNKQLVGGIYREDRLAYSFSDPAIAGHFKGLNAYFKNSCNVTLYDTDATRRRFLLKVTGPRQPGAFYLYDREAKTVDALGEQKPWLTEARLAPMESLRVTSRDGVALTAYLTAPLAKGPRPLIVMPHGGPEIRDSYEYSIWVQHLAAQGWYVLQPNFRGSGGYGKAFAEAGHRRWADRMQEDVEDCVAHVIASGRVDAGRVAILGASYGGYAALMGVVRQPKLYRCAVAIAADSDLELSMRFTRQEDGADSPAYAYWLKQMGDPAVDGEAMRAASPRHRVGEIESPILLIHGTEDEIVTPESSRLMARTLASAGKRHELVELRGLGHRNWPDEKLREVLVKSTDFIVKAFKA